MKKLISIIAAAVMSAMVALSGVAGMFAYAADGEVSDVKINCKDAKDATTWGKSISVAAENFAVGRITTSTQIIVSYKITDKTKYEDLTSSPVGLALQSFEDPDNALADDKGSVWAEVTPKTYDETSATFYYEDIVKAYTSKDFSKIEYLHVIAPGATTIKCTGLIITDCLDKAPAVTTTTEAKKEEVSESETTAATTQATTQATTVAAAPKAESTSPIILIIGIVAGVAIAVVIIIIIMNRKSREAFDVSTGKFVDKKNLFDKHDDGNSDK